MVPGITHTGTTPAGKGRGGSNHQDGLSEMADLTLGLEKLATWSTHPVDGHESIDWYIELTSPHSPVWADVAWSCTPPQPAGSEPHLDGPEGDREGQYREGGPPDLHGGRNGEGPRLEGRDHLQQILQWYRGNG